MADRNSIIEKIKALITKTVANGATERAADTRRQPPTPRRGPRDMPPAIAPRSDAR
jgi:hypothetical protein